MLVRLGFLTYLLIRVYVFFFPLLLFFALSFPITILLQIFACKNKDFCLLTLTNFGDTKNDSNIVEDDSKSCRLQDDDSCFAAAVTEELGKLTIADPLLSVTSFSLCIRSSLIFFFVKYHAQWNLLYCTSKISLKSCEKKLKHRFWQFKTNFLSFFRNFFRFKGFSFGYSGKAEKKVFSNNLRLFRLSCYCTTRNLMCEVKKFSIEKCQVTRK